MLGYHRQPIRPHTRDASRSPSTVAGDGVETSIDAPAAWVNPRDPARALGTDGRPKRSPRAAAYADVPDDRWDDWRWQLSNRVNDLDALTGILALTDEEREADDFVDACLASRFRDGSFAAGEGDDSCVSILDTTCL